LLNAGQLDTAFGSDGVVEVPVAARNANITDIAVLSDGRFMITGSSDGQRLTVMRFHADGTPDGSFGVNGRAVSTLPGSPEVLAVQVLENGQAIVAGWQNTEYFLLKYRTNGKHDRTFGDGGLVRGRFEGNRSIARDLAVLSDGRIVVAGEATLGNASNAVAVSRYNPDGTRDATFSINGEAVTKFSLPMGSAATFSINKMAVAPDGSLYLGGRFYSGAGTADTDDSLAVMRFTANGAADARFNADGLALREMAAFGETATDIAVDGLNRPVVSVGGAGVLAAVRFDNRGRADDAFGRRGSAVVSEENANTTAIALQEDGRVVLAGSIADQPRLARLTGGGLTDATFGSQGISAPVPFQSVATVEELAISQDGTILAGGGGGLRNVAGARQLSLARYFSDAGPAGTLLAKNLRGPRLASWAFDVEWRDTAGVDVDTLGRGNLIVSGPNAYSEFARLLSVNEIDGPNRVVARYSVSPPGRAWTTVDSGVYTVQLLPQQVADLTGNFAAARTLGTFRVIIGVDLPPA
jgi:uncharacterized delta-60 repeat protein